MIISKDLFIFGEHIFGIIIPENTGNITSTATSTTTTQPSAAPATIGLTQLQQQQHHHQPQHHHHHLQLHYNPDNPENNTINVSSKPIISIESSLSSDDVNKNEVTSAITVEPLPTDIINKNQALSKQEAVTTTTTDIPTTNNTSSPTTTTSQNDIQRITDDKDSRNKNRKFKQHYSIPSSSVITTSSSSLYSSSMQPTVLLDSSSTNTSSMEGGDDQSISLQSKRESSPPFRNLNKNKSEISKHSKTTNGESCDYESRSCQKLENSKLTLLRETLQSQQIQEANGAVNLTLAQPQIQQNIIGSKREIPFNNHNYQSGMDNVTLNKNSRNESETVRIPFITETQRSLQLSFQNVTVLHNERKILNDISGIVSPGEVLAIMGPSGCGKTTLLDCLSGQRHIDSGSICVNREFLSKKWRRKICYVLQDEIFFSGLTLRETVMYTALLRLPEKTPTFEKVKLVDSILQSLELTFCQNTKFGDYMNRGLSGGEKKRANIACELITNPLLMLLDEPTSGLDSHSAISLMKILKRYAIHEQKTIVITVHQPSSQMFHMFDKLLLLYNGCTAYFGEVNNIYRYFEDIGVAIEPHYNPAEFVLEQLKSNPDIREKLFIAAKESHANFLNRNCIRQSGFINDDLGPTLMTKTSHPPMDVSNKNCMQHDVLITNILSNYYTDMHNNHSKNILLVNNHITDVHHHHDDSGSCEEVTQQLWYGGDSQSNFSTTSSDCRNYDWLDYPTRFTTQFCVLSSRNFKEAKSRMLSKLNWFQTIGLALMAGAIWCNIPRTEEYLHDLQGWMFFSQTYWMLFALFGALNSFPSEREVINKERRSGSYRLSAYYLAKMFGELPLVITLPTVYLMISYPMLGCPRLFFLMLIFLLLNTLVAQSVGFFIGACCMDMNVSITLSALYTLATQLFGGYLSTRIPDFLSWIRYTSMIHYAYQNMQILEFSEGSPIECSQPSSYEVCKHNTTKYIPYEEILKAQNSTSPLWLNTLVLTMFFLVFRVLGYAVLRYIRCPKT